MLMLNIAKYFEDKIFTNSNQVVKFVITNLMYSKACNFYLWCPLFVVTIAQNVII